MKFNTDILARLVAACGLLQPIVAYIWSPRSASYRMVQYESLFSYPVLLALLALSVLVFLDVTVNTMFECGKCQLGFLSKIRDKMYMAGAFFIVNPLYTVSKQEPVGEVSTFIYLVTCGVLFALFCLDANAKRNGVDSRANLV